MSSIPTEFARAPLLAVNRIAIEANANLECDKPVVNPGIHHIGVSTANEVASPASIMLESR
jgi:hypothetical protein